MQKQLVDHYKTVRQKTLALCEPLTVEDHVVQSMDDVSPPKWHLAHTSWFFETFILKRALKQYKVFNPEFIQRFNSYYQQVANPYPRAQRGWLSRPSLEEIKEYRQYIDDCMLKLLAANATATNKIWLPYVELGLHHEQQHQELILMDVKYNFYQDPRFPSYQPAHKVITQVKPQPLEFIEVDGGFVDIGHADHSFCLDNELPQHKQFLHAYKIANRLITNGEYLEFIIDGGYKKPQYWLFEGWEFVRKQQLAAPLYWQTLAKNKWGIFTLSGLQPLNLNEPVAHISYYEADAFARWKKARLPTEIEWEHFVQQSKQAIVGNFLEQNHLHPQAQKNAKTGQFFGDVWEWTASAYNPYPGYKPLKGAVGEYNGKFMCNQFVLRGGSCLTPQSHMRKTYRNYFAPDKRWQCSGIRLASNLGKTK